MSDYEQVSGTTVSFDLAGFEYEQVSGTTVDIELQLRDPQPGTFSATSTFEGVGRTERVGQFSATSTFTSVGTASASQSGTFQPTATFSGPGSGSAVAQVGTFSATSTFTGGGPNAGLFEPQTTFGADTIGLTGDNLPVEWRVTRDGEFVEDTVFDVDPVVDTANPFGDYAVIKMDDSNGEKFANYARGTRVDVAVSENAGITFDNRFTGYVVERRETEQNGADVLEVEAYSFDQFLRRNTVTNDQTGNLISEALEDIITTDTPVTYVAGNIDVGDEQELTRSYQGEAVETVLRDLAFKSNNEDFGVNDDLEFFFRERENVHIDRGIDNTQWFNYDIPELGKETTNEVEVWFDGGEESVIVDDGTDKLDLQDSLGLADPGTQRAELNRPLITDINDAEDEGRKYLQFRNSTLSGTVTTFGLFDAKPGDTIDIEIQPRGIDEEFVIAAIEYRWGVDETILTIVEKRGDVDDILSELNESVQRVEMEGANRDAPKNRITTTDAGAIVGVDVTPEPDGVRFVNDGRRAVRDTWTGDGPPDIATLVVGDDGSGLSRSNSELRNQTNSAAVSQSLPDTTSVVFEATITQTGVREVGLETTDGRLITRAVFDDAIDIDGTVSVTLDVSNDGSVSRGVLTNDGQTAVRDVLADNTPALPNAYAYGDDGTAVAESDTTLANELVSVSLDEVEIRSASTNDEWQSVPDLVDGFPVGIQNDRLELLQSCVNLNGRVDRGETNGFALQTGDEYVGGQVVAINQDAGNFIEWVFPPWPYEIERENVGFEVRDELPDGPSMDGSWVLNGEPISFVGLGQSPLDWFDWRREGDWQGSLNTDTTNTLRIEINNTTDANNYNIDQIAIYDNRFDFNFDNELDGPGGNLDGPELFPDLAEQAFQTTSTRRNVTEASFDLSANDVSNEFFVELSNDGESFTRINNSETGNATFEQPESGVDVNIGLSRFGGPQDETPKFGFNGQAIDTWSLIANPDAVLTDDIGTTLSRTIVPSNALSPGATIREAGLKSDSVLLTRHELAAFEVIEGQRISSSETTRFTGNN